MRLFQAIFVVAGATEIGNRAARGRRRCPCPEVTAPGVVSCVAHAARAHGRMQPERLADGRGKLRGVVGATQ